MKGMSLNIHSKLCCAAGLTGAAAVVGVQGDAPPYLQQSDLLSRVPLDCDQQESHSQSLHKQVKHFESVLLFKMGRFYEVLPTQLGFLHCLCCMYIYLHCLEVAHLPLSSPPAVSMHMREIGICARSCRCSRWMRTWVSRCSAS